MIFREFTLSSDKFIQLVLDSPEKSEEYLRLYSDRRFYIGDTGINRKTLNAWKNNDLLPYALVKSGWQKLSFIECCWLLCIRELSSLGLSLKKIKEIKKELFYPKSLREIIIYSFENFTGKKRKDHKEVLELYKNRKITDRSLKKVFDQMQISFFSICIASTIVENLNICFIYSKAGNIKLGVFDFIANQNHNQENQLLLADVFGDSFVGINLRSIIAELLNKNMTRQKINLAIEFLNPKEKIILRQIREKNAKEIIIKFNGDKEPTHIRVTRGGITEEALNKVARYLKKGNFKSIEFTTRDGELIKYDETDVIKLD